MKKENMFLIILILLNAIIMVFTFRLEGFEIVLVLSAFLFVLIIIDYMDRKLHENHVCLDNLEEINHEFNPNGFE